MVLRMRMRRVAFGFATAVFAAMLPAAANAATAVTTSNVNLRQGPSTDYPVITTLPGNTAVEIEGCAQGWCKVDYAGAAGWMSEDFLQGLSSPPAIVLPVPIIVPGRHHHLRPPIYRPPVVRPPIVRPPHHRPPGIHPPRPMPPGIHPPRPPHHRPPGGGRPPGGRPPGGPGAGPKPPGIHPPPQHRPPGGGHRPPGGGGGRPRPGTQG
jgi:SH3 domain-containing protein